MLATYINYNRIVTITRATIFILEATWSKQKRQLPQQQQRKWMHRLDHYLSNQQSCHCHKNLHRLSHHHHHRHYVHGLYKNPHPKSNYTTHHVHNNNKEYLSTSTNININTSGDGRIVSFNLSDIGEGISEVVIKEWFVKVGDHVQQFDNICEVQSDKASVTITSRYDGLIQKIYYQTDDTAKVGLPLVDILIDEEESSTKLKPESQPIVIDERESITNDSRDYLGGGKILTTPAVRRLAIEHKINLNNVVGTGKDGRILKEDVLNHMNNADQKQSILDQATPPTPEFIKSSIPVVQQKKQASLSEDRIEPMSNIMKGMFKTMTKSLSVPHFGLSEEIDLTHLVKLRPEIKKISLEKNVPISFMPFFIKAASIALNVYPILNSTIDKAGEKIIYKKSHNIGIAMDTKQGLLVPNIKNVNQMTILEIAQELNRLQELGRKRQLSIADLSGGTFTLSNIGSIGGIFGVPVLMPSEVAIGAIGRVRQVPRFVDDSSDQIRRAHVIQVLWSADHRIIDGATMTRFCKLWKDYLENPLKIFI